ncbi:MAG: neurogenic locus notch [Legionellaceae bacterium]|nr:neurogenic locus notch [Legionellaceae bacterium]
MNTLYKSVIISSMLVLGSINIAYSEDVCTNTCDTCCGKMDGIRYCDSSSGRYVCNNGRYSSCYCTIHAVMDLQKVAGCCLWQGGVLKVSKEGIVKCRNGSASEMCSVNYNYNNQY